MWQIVFAAAVAGTGFFARQLFSNGDLVKGNVSERPEKCKEEEKENVVEVEKEEEEEEEESVHSVNRQVSISSIGCSAVSPSGSGEIRESWTSERQDSPVGEEGIFRFSSLGYGEESRSRLTTKGLRKKVGVRGNVDGVRRRVGVEKIGEGSNFMNGDGVVVVHRKKGKRFSVCLKRRRTSKIAFGKCEFCSSKGNSFLNRGLDVGIMYMVSAGKAEIDKLNAAVDETTKVVHDLKSELYKRKFSRDLQDSSFKNRVNACLKDTMRKDKQPLITKSGAEYANRDDSRVLGLLSTDDGECASSVLTEEPQLEVLEYDQLEAELESELQKISCTSEECSGLIVRRPEFDELDPEHIVDITNAEVSANGPPGMHDVVGTDSDTFQCHGVSPFELDRKLCHLLIKQQESQIGELESELHSAQTKFHEKESELQALKDCVRQLREFSLETTSDDETEEAEVLNAEQEWNSECNSLTSARLLVDGAEKSLPTVQKSVVGMKRTMDFDSYNCHVMH